MLDEIITHDVTTYSHTERCIIEEGECVHLSTPLITVTFSSIKAYSTPTSFVFVISKQGSQTKQARNI